MLEALKDSDDQEVFEIQDYTTASEWERFTANMEEILRDWQLTSSDCKHPPYELDIHSSKVQWQEKTTTIKFSDFSFNVTHHFLTYEHDEALLLESSKEEKDDEDEEICHYLRDVMNFKNDFPGKAHCLVRWYGLREFITLVPTIPSQPISSPSKARVVLSSLSLAANNTSCEIPLFLQINELTDKVFLGVGYGPYMRTDFEMAHVKVPPPQCTHLSGLLDIFKSKIGSSLTSAPVMVSIRFTYILSDWPHTLWSQSPPDLDAALSDVGFSELGRLPFGALSDPVSELQVSTTWPCVSEYSLIDSEVQSDLNPSSAPIWSARLGSSAAPPCLLSEYLSEYIHVCETSHSLVEILGHDFDPTIDDGSNIINALDRLTSTAMPSFSSMNSKSRSKPSSRGDRGPISDETLSLLLNFLFPDAQNLQEESAPYDPSTFSLVPPWTPPVEGLPQEHPLQNVFKKMKSCDVDSFAWRLSILLCHATHSLGGLPSVAHLFYEVLLELRFRWDNAILVPGLPEGPPDMSTCLINQKLQMLNCCISHRIARENYACGVSIDDPAEDEEFYECEEDVENETDSGKEYSSWDKPEGRLKRFGNARLLKRKDYIYIPVTQEAAPYTEDILEEQTGELLKLGSDSSGSCQRAKLMSSSLLSDMESFKAANPGSILEDFVRWYSPRDWVEEYTTDNKSEQKVKGHLSKRMLIPGNLWREVWDNAKPVPARRQKRLFDDTREAEKVLHWFNTLSPGVLCKELMPVVMHASICRLAEEPVLYTLSAIKEESLPQPIHDDSLSAQLELLAKRVSRLSRQPSNIFQYKSVYFQIDRLERCVAKAQSLRLKLLGHTTVSSLSLKSSPNNCQPMSHIDSEKVDHGDESTSQKGDSNLSSIEDSPLESLVTKLLHQSEVTLDGGAKGIQASVIKKLFSDSLNSLYSEETPLAEKEKIEPHKYDPTKRETSRDIELGKPAGREYILRTQANFPADHSRSLSQRLYAVILKKSFRMAGVISQDTLFC